MSTARSRTLAALLTAGALLLTGCAGAGSDELPDIDTGQQALDAPSVIGVLDGLTEEKITLRLVNGDRREFVVRPGSADELGVESMRTHLDDPGVGFKVFFETQDGVDYALAAHETAPLKPKTDLGPVSEETAVPS